MGGIQADALALLAHVQALGIDEFDIGHADEAEEVAHIAAATRADISLFISISN